MAIVRILNFIELMNNDNIKGTPFINFICSGVTSNNNNNETKKKILITKLL